MENNDDGIGPEYLPYTTFRVHDTGVMANQIRMQGRELMILKDSVNGELMRLKEEILNLREQLEKRKREEDQEDDPSMVDSDDDDNEAIPLIVIETMNCLVCKNNKPIKAFQIAQNKKSTEGVVLSSRIKTRKTCNACYTRRYREKKKARTTM